MKVARFFFITHELITMKFRILLWLLGRMLAKASAKNPAMQEKLADKQLAFTLHSLDNSVARSYFVRQQRISSTSGVTEEPVFSIGFRDPAYGFSVLTAKNKQLAFMQGIQSKDIQIKGDTAQVIWFQGLFKYLGKKKAKPAQG